MFKMKTIIQQNIHTLTTFQKLFLIILLCIHKLKICSHWHIKPTTATEIYYHMDCKMMRWFVEKYISLI